MPDPIISVDGIGKAYRIGLKEERYRTFRDALVGAVKAPFRRLQKLRERTTGHDIFWALKDVSFEVQQGEVLGIIGRNGAGKSTLLKILTRITDPTEGTARLRGRVASLLEVGTGFHPELTGRENVYLNAAILGMRKAEIARKFDEIVAFAEIDKFLDTPVKHYSSGMYVRLAFAVAAHLEPEVLLVDEVLAVGDAAFQKKCLGKMSDVARAGRTVLFVSHNMGAVAALCTKALHLASGQVKSIGAATQVVTSYLTGILGVSGKDLDQLRLPGYGTEAKIVDASLLSDDRVNILFGEPLVFRIAVASNADLDGLSLGCSLFNSLGACVGTLFTEETFSVRRDERMHMRLDVRDPRLAPGSYYAGFGLGHGGPRSVRRDLDVVIGEPVFNILPVSGGTDHLACWNPAWGSIVFGGAQLSLGG